MRETQPHPRPTTQTYSAQQGARGCLFPGGAPCLVASCRRTKATSRPRAPSPPARSTVHGAAHPPPGPPMGLEQRSGQLARVGVHSAATKTEPEVQSAKPLL